MYQLKISLQSNEEFTITVASKTSYTDGFLLNSTVDDDLAFTLNQYEFICSICNDEIETSVINETISSDCLPQLVVNTKTNIQGLRIVTNKIEQTFVALYNGNAHNVTGN